NALPNDFAGESIEAKDHELMFAPGAGSPSWTGCGRLWLGKCCAAVCGHGCREKHLVAPDGGRGKATARDPHPPTGGLGIRPLDGCITTGHSIVIGPTPLGPVVVHREQSSGEQ